MTGIIVCTAILVLTQLLAYQRYLISKDAEIQLISGEANAIKDKLQTSLSHSLSATKTLAFIIDRYGVPEDFDSIAAEILESNKFIDAIQLTRKGVITHVFPLQGNERVLGYDILKDSVRSQEALKAIEKKDIFFAGPFPLVQGGTAVVGRLPIFKKGEFFGFSVVLIKLSTLLSGAGIDHLSKDYYYQLSKLNPVTKQEEFFLPESPARITDSSFALEIPDGEWKLYVALRDTTIPGAFFISVLGCLFSLTAGFFTWHLMRQPERLNQLVRKKTREVIDLKHNAVDTIERVSDAFVSLDRNWCYTYMNKKAGEIFQRNPATMIGKHIWTEFPEGVGQPFYHAYHEAMKEQKYIYLEEYYEPYDLWFENHIYPSPNGLSIYFRDVTESKKAAKKIEASEKYFRTLIEKSTDAVVLLDSQRKIIYHSPSTERITGYTFSEIHNQSSLNFIEPGRMDYFDKLLGSILGTAGASVKAQFSFRHKSGKYFWIEGTLTNWLQEENISAIVFNYHDITERIEAEEKIKTANRLYQFTARINQMIVYAKEETTVFNEACQIAVEIGKFKMAWIGKYDRAEQTVTPVSIAGPDDGYVSRMKAIPLHEYPNVQGPTATAINKGVYVHCNDIENDPTMKPWLSEALTRSFRASISLPIKKNATVVGVFNIYSDQTFCFNENEIDLLEEATNNISFALENLEREELRKAAEKLIENEKIFSDSLINSLPGVFYLYDHNGRFLRWNKNFEIVSGYNAMEIKQMHPLDLFTGKEKERVEEKILEVFKYGHAEVIAEFVSKQNVTRPYFFNGRKVVFDGNDYLIGVGIDVSEQIKVEKELIERNDEIQKLTGYLQNIREEERTHIAREIHDVIGQQLTAMKMDASWIRKKNLSEEAEQRLTGMIELIDETIKTVRRISTELRPGVLDDLGLVAALEWQTREFEKNTGMRTAFSSEFSDESLDRSLATNVFRVYQEALTNIARHSNATFVETILEKKNMNLLLLIRDNGIGFDVNSVRSKKSLGLVGMKERARMLNGALTIDANVPSGTVVSLNIPLKESVNLVV